MFASKSALKLAIASVGLCGAALIWSPAAEAGARTGTWRDGSVATPYGVYNPYRNPRYGYRAARPTPAHRYARPAYRQRNSYATRSYYGPRRAYGPRYGYAPRGYYAPRRAYGYDYRPYYR